MWSQKDETAAVVRRWVERKKIVAPLSKEQIDLLEELVDDLERRARS